MPDTQQGHPPPGWVKTDLLTRSGQRVTTAWIPNFNPPPEIISWGERHFTRQIVAGAGWRYLEGLRWVIPVSDLKQYTPNERNAIDDHN